MADIQWPKGSTQYKIGNKIHTSAGITVQLREGNVSLVPFSIGKVRGACKIEVPLSSIDDLLNAICEAQREAEAPKGQVRRRLSKVG